MRVIKVKHNFMKIHVIPAVNLISSFLQFDAINWGKNLNGLGNRSGIILRNYHKFSIFSAIETFSISGFLSVMF